jgi:IclR family transcriptional regulator, KDG regulon repressor
MPDHPIAPLVNLPDRIFAILRLFIRDQPSWSIGEVVDAIGLPKATVHRLMRVMCCHEMLQRSKQDGRYRLGPLAFALGTWSSDRHELRRLGRPILKRLAELTGETALIFELAQTGDSLICIEQIESHHGLRLVANIGVRMPMIAGASGRAVLSFLADEDRGRVIDDAVALGGRRATTSRADLDRKLRQTRKTGYARSVEETTKGACGIAAPLFDGLNAVVGAIAITGPTSRLTTADLDRHAKHLLQCAKELTREIGGSIARYPR